jgi:ATP-dependent DNA helicase RecG
MNPFEPENLPPKDLDLLALMPMVGKANRAIATLEGLFYGIPNPSVLLSPISAVLLAPRKFEDMDRNDRIRACYQHCCLCYVLHGKMTNQSIRERFKLPEEKSASASQTIAATLEAGKIKLADPAKTAPRYRSYLPFWA